MSELESKAVDLLDKLESLAVQFAPETIEMSLAAVRITAAGDILRGVVFITLAVLGASLISRNIAYCRVKDAESRFALWDLGAFMSFVVGGMVVFIFAMQGVMSVVDTWNWVALFSPELALAHKITGL